MFKEIETVSSVRESNDFNNKINALKKIRTTADYGKEEILHNVSNKVLSLSSDIIALIKKHLKL